MLSRFANDAPIRRKISLIFTVVTLIAVGTSGMLWWRESTLDVADPASAAALGALARVSLIAVLVEAAALASLGVAFRRAIANPYVTTVVRMEAFGGRSR